MPPNVVAVHISTSHSFSKGARQSITLVEGQGVEGDAHSGSTVKHRSRVRKDPEQPNLRQVHLIHSELLGELRRVGFPVEPGLMGENITTVEIDLLSLPTGARLSIGDQAVIELTGLRNPCTQLDSLAPGLMKAVIDRDSDGELVRKSGVMAIVITGGEIRSGDKILVELPVGARRQLEPV